MRDTSNDLIYATASSTDCSRIRPKSDQRVCNKLTGTLTVASYQTEQSKDGDFIVYADVDRNKDQNNKWLMNLLQFMHLSNTSLALYEMDLLERQYNKRDAYQYYCGAANQVCPIIKHIIIATY
jgi:hypothetical protein